MEVTDITVRKMAETERAVLVTDGTPEEAVWLPKSQIEIMPSDKPGLYDVTLPEWLAEEKGLA